MSFVLRSQKPNLRNPRNLWTLKGSDPQITPMDADFFKQRRFERRRAAEVILAAFLNAARQELALPNDNLKRPLELMSASPRNYPSALQSGDPTSLSPMVLTLDFQKR